MEQEKIWDYLQNEGLHEGAFSDCRQRYMVKKLHPGKRVLNIGVGAGGLERHAILKEVDIHALDPSEKSIERLRKELGLGERAKAGYAQEIPFPGDYFDVVVMSEVLEHLSDDVLRDALHEVLRVLRPGGVLLASTPYMENLLAKRVVCPGCGAVFHKIGHVQSFDKPAMTRLLIKSGFQINRIWVTTFIDWKKRGIFSLVKSIIRLVLARMGEPLADPHLLVLAKKAC